MLSLDEYRTAQDELTSLALSDTRLVLQALGGAPPDVVRDTLIELLPDVLAPYMTASGELSGMWLEELRRDAGLPVSYAQVVGDTIDPDRLGALVRWSVTPLFDPDSVVTVESLLGAGAQRLVLQSARETMLQGMEREPGPVGFARMPRAGCCAFCAMLASRGAVYSSAESASGVVGTGLAHTEGKTFGVDPRTGRVRTGGVKSRGPRGLGMDKYHDNCYCVAVAVYPFTEMAELVAASAEDYLTMYQQAASELPTTGETYTLNGVTHERRVPRTEANMLAAMRREHNIR